MVVHPKNPPLKKTMREETAPVTGNPLERSPDPTDLRERIPHGEAMKFPIVSSLRRLRQDDERDHDEEWYEQ